MNTNFAPLIVLIAHGAPRFPQTLAFFQALADLVAAQRPESKVRILMMRGEPSVDQFPAILAQTPPQVPVVVVPLFLSDGYYTKILVPRTLRLDAITSHRVRNAPPLGCHPHMAAYLTRTALDACPFPPADTRLLLVAHGSRQGKSGDTAAGLARQMLSMATFADVQSAYLEQEPWARDWPHLFPQGNVLILPLILAPGQHGNQDIPDLIKAVIPDKRNADPGLKGNTPILATQVSHLPLNAALVQMVVDLTDYREPSAQYRRCSVSIMAGTCSPFRR